MVVEDTLTLLAVMTRGLELSGFQVTACPLPAQALERLAELEDEGRAPDLILSDVSMPEMTGFAMVDRMRSAGYRGEVVFMSGYGDEILREHGLTREEVTLLHKPVRIGALSVLLRETLEQQEAAET